MVHSCCASTSSITVTSMLTAHGHSSQHRRAPTVYKSRWRPRVSPSTSRSSVSNPRSTFTEYHREHPTGLSGEGERGRPDAGAASAAPPGDLRTELIRWSRSLRSGGRSFRAGVCFCCVITRSLRKMRNTAVRTITGITGGTGFNPLGLFTLTTSNENDEY